MAVFLGIDVSTTASKALLIDENGNILGKAGIGGEAVSVVGLTGQMHGLVLPWEHEIEGGWRNGMWTPEAQAEFIEQVYRQCFGHPSVVSINYWGFSDRNIWMPGGGLIDAEYRPKPTFKTLKNLI